MTQQSRSIVLTTLSDLKQVKNQLAQHAKARELAALRLAQQQAAREKSARLFIDTVGSVEPIKHNNGVNLLAVPPAPIAIQRLMDESQVMKDSLSDDFGVEQLLDTDTDLSYRTTGISVEVLNKLRRGDWAIQGQLDLHGFRVDGARQALTEFIHHATDQGWRCVRIVHGKGLGSKDRQPVLKNKVRSWLVQTKVVQCFVAARASEGGAGALVVLLAGT
jgi:DNA-nicking Smr family endonuclease